MVFYERWGIVRDWNYELSGWQETLRRIRHTQVSCTIKSFVALWEGYFPSTEEAIEEMVTVPWFLTRSIGAVVSSVSVVAYVTKRQRRYNVRYVITTPTLEKRGKQLSFMSKRTHNMGLGIAEHVISSFCSSRRLFLIFKHTLFWRQITTMYNILNNGVKFI